MPTDLAPTIALGVGSALLAFEGFAALKSLVDINGFGNPAGKGPEARLHREPLVLTSKGEIRAHLLARRKMVDGVRRRYPTLASSRHGLELRAEIRRVRRHPGIGHLPALPPAERGWLSVEDERGFDLRPWLSRAYSLMTPTRNRITRTMTITPTIPTPPLL